MTNGLVPKHPSSWSVMTRQLAVGIIVGCVVSSVPWLASKLNYERLWPLNFLDLPGLIKTQDGCTKTKFSVCR
jgi:hypothetical protein